ncbi:MAG: DUF3526 domain-containing protein, partial [Algicola sp.]|nr:DUF3526 domain-containing protein [Algicola sp.]
DSTQSRNFYHRYMASQKIVKEELEPIVGEYEDQLQKQQEWSRKLQWLSPAIVVQESLNQLAGTSTTDYENYRGQVIEFAGTWRTHLITFLYNNATFSQQDYASLPQFTYSNNTNRNIGFSSVVLLLIAAALLIFGFAVQGRSEKKGMLSH